MLNWIKSAFSGAPRAEVSEPYRFLDALAPGLAAWAEAYVRDGAEARTLQKVADMMQAQRAARQQPPDAWAAGRDRLVFAVYTMRGRPEALSRLARLNALLCNWGTAKPADWLGRAFQVWDWQKRLAGVEATELTAMEDVAAALGLLGMTEQELFDRWSVFRVNLPDARDYVRTRPPAMVDAYLDRFEAKRLGNGIANVARLGALSAPDKLPLLMARMGHGAATVRKAATAVIVAHHAEAAVALVAEALPGAPVAVRADLAKLLGEIGSEAAHAALATHRETERAAAVLGMIDSYLAAEPEAQVAQAEGYVDAWDRFVPFPDHPPIEHDDGSAPLGADLVEALRPILDGYRVRAQAAHDRSVESYERHGRRTREPRLYMPDDAETFVARLNDPDPLKPPARQDYRAGPEFHALVRDALAQLPLTRVVHLALHGSFRLRPREPLEAAYRDIYAEHMAQALEDGRLGLTDYLAYRETWRARNDAAVRERRAAMGDPVQEPVRTDAQRAADVESHIRGIVTSYLYPAKHDDPPRHALWEIAAPRLDLIAAKLPPREADPKTTLRAFDVIAAFPSLPKALVGPLLDAALDPRMRVARAAQALLRGVPGIEATLAERLSDKRQPVRAGAARMLAARGATGAVPALEARLKKERAEIARGEMIAALAALGDASAFLSPVALGKEADRLVAKLPEAPLDGAAAPALTWADGTTVDPVVPEAWLRLAHKLKTPLGVPLLSVWMNQLAPESARALSGWILDAWLERAFRPHDDASARAEARLMLPTVLYQGRTAGLEPNASLVASRTDAEVMEALVARYRTRPALKQSDAKGILALTGHAHGPTFGARFSPWLKRNGGDQNAAKALVDALYLMGSREAVQALVATATRFRQKTVRALAETRLGELAEARGWTEDELADRSVPDAGFDAEGALALPVDADTVYALRLLDDLSVRLSNPAGKVVKSLPARAEAKEAKAALSATRKALKSVATEQGARLRDAMLTGRSWDAAAWAQDVAGHVLLRRLAQRLVWRGFDADGAAVVSFRPTPEDELVDAEGDPLDLSAVTHVDLAHSAVLSEADRAAWTEHLSDYEVAPLFDQLTRPVMRLPEGPAPARIEDRARWALTTFALRGAAAKLGYERGPIEDGGGFSAYVRDFRGAGLRAVLAFEGSAVNEEDWPTHLEAMAFERLDQPRAVPLDRVPPILLSEVWCDLHDIAKVATPPKAEEGRG